MKIVAVFHGEKVEGVDKYRQEIGANPPMTPEGMEKILDLVPTIRALGPYSAMYTSRIARAGDTASVLAIELDMDYRTIKDLGQHGNLDRTSGKVIMHPHHEDESYTDWQDGGLRAITQIFNQHTADSIILVVSHRPVIGGLVAHTLGITNNEGLKDFIRNPKLTEKGYAVFEFGVGQDLKMVS